jgi:hypothetical protein
MSNLEPIVPAPDWGRQPNVPDHEIFEDEDEDEE